MKKKVPEFLAQNNRDRQVQLIHFIETDHSIRLPRQKSEPIVSKKLGKVHTTLYTVFKELMKMKIENVSTTRLSN